MWLVRVFCVEHKSTGKCSFFLKLLPYFPIPKGIYLMKWLSSSDDRKTFITRLQFRFLQKSPSAFSTNEVTASPSTVPGPKPKLAAKPALASKPTAPPRRSIFDTAVAGGKDGLVSCSICGRNFASDRISKHESVCAKSKSKKRKIFDITKMRVKGTEAESYVLNQKPQYTTTLSTNSTQAPKSNHGVGLQNSRPQPYNAPASSISANTSTVKASQATKAVNSVHPSFVLKLNSLWLQSSKLDVSRAVKGL